MMSLFILISCSSDKESQEIEIINPILVADTVKVVFPYVVSEVSGKASFSLPESGFIVLVKGQLIKEDRFHFITPEANIKISCADGDILEFNSAQDVRHVMFER